MKIGFCIPNYGGATSKDALDDSAKLAEKHNYEHIWTTDHLLIPEDFASPYGKCLESLATLSYLAGKTEHVRLGTSIIILPLREVVLFAKQAAAIQIFSNDRLMLGVGAGWNETEFHNLRADFDGRGQYYDEEVQLFRWLMKGNSEFKGDFYSITNGVFGPLPIREIPLFFGGNGGPSLRRAAKFGDGWHPVGVSPEEIRKGVEKLHKLTDRKMRIIARLAVNFKEKTIKQRESKARHGLSGNSSEIISRIRDYGKAGATDIVCYFGDVSANKILSSSKKFALEVLPSL
jgi:probable F420-dependent oxidoreductase